MCVVYAYICICICVCIQLWVYTEARSVFPYIFSHPSFETGFLTVPKLTDWARLAGQWSLGMYLTLLHHQAHLTEKHLKYRIDAGQEEKFKPARLWVEMRKIWGSGMLWQEIPFHCIQSQCRGASHLGLQEQNGNHELLVFFSSPSLWLAEVLWYQIHPVLFQEWKGFCDSCSQLLSLCYESERA